MGLGVGVARWLRKQGHNAVHLREIDMQRADDDTIFFAAVRRGAS